MSPWRRPWRRQIREGSQAVTWSQGVENLRQVRSNIDWEQHTFSRFGGYLPLHLMLVDSSQLAAKVTVPMQAQLGNCESVAELLSDCGERIYHSDTNGERRQVSFTDLEIGMPKVRQHTVTTTVVDCPIQFERLGGTRRPHRPGPESELVDWFLDRRPYRVPRGCRATIFREPRLMSGFPDIVLVFWRERAAEHWREDRVHLRDAELRLMHYLVQHGDSSTDELKKFFSCDVDERIERLVAAGLLRRICGTWKPRALSQCFAVREIIAIEAKMSDWATALQQAFLNTWFASQSYVLVPSVPRGERLLDQAASLNLGVWSRTDSRCIKPASTSSQLPISYSSWLFNEWVWRAESQIAGHL